MGYDKRYVAQRRHRRRRKAAKAKMKLYEAGKLAYEKLPMLSRRMIVKKATATRTKVK